MSVSEFEIECVLCQGSRSMPVISENGFIGRQCLDCGLIFISPRPSRREIESVYRLGEAQLSPDWFVRSPEPIASRLRARRDAGLVQRQVLAGSLLEIGPGRGTFLAAARRRGFKVFGVELNPTQASFIRTERAIPCVESLEQASELGSGEFDVVYHRDVLSHFYDPHEQMERVRTLLKPGGFHIFETGNLADVDHRYLKLIRSFQYPDHLFFYGERSLRKLLDQTGFDRVHTYRWSLLPERWVRSQVSRARGIGTAGHTARPEVAASGVTPGGVARQALDLLYYGLQVSVGRIPVGEEIPQTLIVVAQKR
jgi:SAM-dependent methyltransferase